MWFSNFLVIAANIIFVIIKQNLGQTLPFTLLEKFKHDCQFSLGSISHIILLFPTQVTYVEQRHLKLIQRTVLTKALIFGPQLVSRENADCYLMDHFKR